MSRTDLRKVTGIIKRWMENLSSGDTFELLENVCIFNDGIYQFEVQFVFG